MKNPRQHWLKRGIDGFGLKLEAHPQIRRGAQQQAQQATGLGQKAIDLMVTALPRAVKRRGSVPDLGGAKKGGNRWRRAEMRL